MKELHVLYSLARFNQKHKIHAKASGSNITYMLQCIPSIDKFIIRYKPINFVKVKYQLTFIMKKQKTKTTKNNKKTVAYTCSSSCYEIDKLNTCNSC